MKIKTFYTEVVDRWDDFDREVSEFMVGKQVISVSSSDALTPYDDYVHTVTVIYLEVTKDDAD